MAKVYSFDVGEPENADAPSGGAAAIRLLKDAIHERENQDHYWEKSGDTADVDDIGFHRKITLLVQSSAPTQKSNAGILYGKDVSTKCELFYRDEDGDEVQITSGGALNIAAADHGSLTGLTDDDHSIYLNATRHDADDHSSFSYTTMGSGILPTTYGGTGKATLLYKATAYTGNATDNRNVAHGLGVTPTLVIIIPVTSAVAVPTIWATGMALGRDFNAASDRADALQAVDATNVQLGTLGWVNASGTSYIMHCFGTQS